MSGQKKPGRAEPLKIKPKDLQLSMLCYRCDLHPRTRNPGPACGPTLLPRSDRHWDLLHASPASAMLMLRRS